MTKWEKIASLYTEKEYAELLRCDGIIFYIFRIITVYYTYITIDDTEALLEETDDEDEVDEDDEYEDDTEYENEEEVADKKDFSEDDTFYKYLKDLLKYPEKELTDSSEIEFEEDENK